MAGPEGSKYYNVFLKNKVWLESIDGESVLNENVFKLLQLIQKTNSIKASAEKLKISYRKAWGDLKECEKKLGFRLITKTRGGEGGGQTTLSDEGIELINAYNQLVSDINKSIKKVTKQFFNKINN
ncbi:MAG: LysR family transcriptional regulator [Chlorobi bacterium]|nr:LysR family transcriptional regulator [Chlorobiota bacterium]